MAFNVPLNDALAAVAPSSPEGAALWTRYLAEWLPWNHVRTFANIAALIAFILAYARQAAPEPQRSGHPRFASPPPCAKPGPEAHSARKMPRSTRMYQPPHFREDRLEIQHALIRAHPLGLLISTAAKMARSPMPFPSCSMRRPRPRARCFAHVARANPQWRAARE